MRHQFVLWPIRIQVSNTTLIEPLAAPPAHPRTHQWSAAWLPARVRSHAAATTCARPPRSSACVRVRACVFVCLRVGGRKGRNHVGLCAGMRCGVTCMRVFVCVCVCACLFCMLRKHKGGWADIAQGVHVWVVVALKSYTTTCGVDGRDRRVQAIHHTAIRAHPTCT